MNHTELKQLRANAGVTQKRCAEIVGIQPRQYQRWEAGTVQIPFAERSLLCIGLVFFGYLNPEDVKQFMPTALFEKVLAAMLG